MRMNSNSLQQDSLSAYYSALLIYKIFLVNHRIFQLLVIILIFTFFLPSFSESDEIIWPIDYYKIISSTFGEPRQGRFHYGVDFKSGGITGKKVYSIGDGYISIVRTSPFGYGKTLYINLDSGETVVYGHLSKFMPEIEDSLFILRIRQRSYDVQWLPEPNKFRVQKGQVIAFSGDTGSGAPHLHLEIRDDKNNLLNPMNKGLIVRDTVPPHIDSVVFIPLDNKSSVDGLPIPQWHDFSSPNTNTFYLSGRIGVAVSTWDNINDSENLLGIYQISLAVDSTIVFSKRYDELSYSSDESGIFDYLSGEFYGGKGSVSALFRRTGNLLNFYEGNRILIDNNPESITYHNLHINASDFSNNQVDRTSTVALGERPIFLYCGYNGNGKLRIAGKHNSGILDHAEIWSYKNNNEWILEQNYPFYENQFDINIEIPLPQSKHKVILVSQDSTQSLPAVLNFQHENNSSANSTGLNISTNMYHDCIVVKVSSKYLLASIPTIQVENNGILDSSVLCPVPEGETSWITSVPIPQSSDNHMLIKASAYDQSLNRINGELVIDFSVLKEFSNSLVYSPDSLLTIYSSPVTVYRSSPVTVQTENVESSNTLKKVSKGYRITLGDETLKNSLRVNLTLDSDIPEKAALFISNGNGNINNRWNFVSKERKGEIFTGNINNSGCLSVFEDSTPPTVIPSLPKPGSIVKSTKPLLRARISDEGSGIEGSNSIEMSIDGITIYGEYDYEAQYVSYQLHNPLNTGTHTVKVTVIDRVGNSKTSEWTFGITE